MIYQKIKNIKIKFATIEAYTNLNLKINKNEINKIQHIACGNQVLKILTWNKGNSRAINTIDRITSVIIGNNADIAVINEFNYSYHEDPSLIKIIGYNLEFDRLLDSYGNARRAMYVRNNKKMIDIDSMKVKMIQTYVSKWGFLKKEKCSFMVYIDNGQSQPL